MDFKKTALIFILFISGCGVYSFKGALPPNLKTIYISDFVTNTAFYNIDQNLTIGVTNAFIDDNSLEVVNDRNNADLELRGKITKIKWANFSVAEGAAESKEDRLTVVLSVECYRKDLKKDLWKKSWDRYVLLPTTADQTEVETALQTIVEEFSDDIVLNTVAAW